MHYGIRGHAIKGKRKREGMNCLGGDHDDIGNRVVSVFLQHRQWFVFSMQTSFRSVLCPVEWVALKATKRKKRPRQNILLNYLFVSKPAS